MIARVHEVYLEAVQCILVALHCVSFDFPNFLFGPLDANQRLQTRRAASENSWKTLSGLNKSAAARLLPRLKCPQKHDPLSYFCNIRGKKYCCGHAASGWSQSVVGHTRTSLLQSRSKLMFLQFSERKHTALCRRWAASRVQSGSPGVTAVVSFHFKAFSFHVLQYSLSILCF